MVREFQVLLLELPGLLPSVFMGHRKVTFGTDAIFCSLLSAYVERIVTDNSTTPEPECLPRPILARNPRPLLAPIPRCTSGATVLALLHHRGAFVRCLAGVHVSYSSGRPESVHTAVHSCHGEMVPPW